MVRQPALGLEGGHAPGSGRGHGLAVVVVHHVAGGEHPLHRGGGPPRVRADDVAVRRELQVPLEERGVRRVADGHEQPAHLQLPLLAGVRVDQSERGHELVADHVGHRGVPFHPDLRVGEGTLHHDPRRAEGVAPMDDHHLAGVLGEVGGLFHRRVAAADHRQALASEGGERAVAHRAGGHPAAVLGQPLLVGEVEPVGARPGGDDHRPRVHRLAVGEGEHERGAREVDRGDVLHDRAGAEPLGLLLHAGHQRLAVHPFGKAGEVLDVGGEHELPAGDHLSRRLALDHERVQVGAGSVDSGGPRGRAAAHDHERLGLRCFGHPRVFRFAGGRVETGNITGGAGGRKR